VGKNWATFLLYLCCSRIFSWESPSHIDFRSAPQSNHLVSEFPSRYFGAGGYLPGAPRWCRDPRFRGDDGGRGQNGQGMLGNRLRIISMAVLKLSGHRDW